MPKLSRWFQILALSTLMWACLKAPVAPAPAREQEPQLLIHIEVTDGAESTTNKKTFLGGDPISMVLEDSARLAVRPGSSVFVWAETDPAELAQELRYSWWIDDSLVDAAFINGDSALVQFSMPATDLDLRLVAYDNAQLNLEEHVTLVANAPPQFSSDAKAHGPDSGAVLSVPVGSWFTLWWQASDESSVMLYEVWLQWSSADSLQRVLVNEAQSLPVVAPAISSVIDSAISALSRDTLRWNVVATDDAGESDTLGWRSLIIQSGESP